MESEKPNTSEIKFIENKAPLSTQEKKRYQTRQYANELLASGINTACQIPNHPCDGMTVLHLFTQADAINDIENLIQFGCDDEPLKDIGDRFGFRAIHYATVLNETPNGDETAVFLQNKEISKLPKPCWTVFQGELEELNQLDDPVCQTSFDDAGFGLVHYAAAAPKNRVERLKLLEKKGANLNMKGSRDVTPWFVAAHHGHIDVMDYLLNTKKIVTVNELWLVVESSALHVAAQAGHFSVAQWLIEQKVDPSLMNSKRQLPSALAEENNHTDLQRFLEKKEREADLEMQEVLNLVPHRKSETSVSFARDQDELDPELLMALEDPENTGLTSFELQELIRQQEMLFESHQSKTKNASSKNLKEEVDLQEIEKIHQKY